MKISIISIFPDYFSPLEISLLGTAQKNGIIDIKIINPRQFAAAPHHNVDDTPYGGGAGMVMRADILKAAIEFAIFGEEDAKNIAKSTSVNAEDCLADGQRAKVSEQNVPSPKIIFTSPAGRKFNQKIARELALAPSKTNENCGEGHLIFVCGRFEGYDQRIVEFYEKKFGKNAVFEMSIGDYVLFGGEVAVLTMIESIARLIPGVVGNPESIENESHEKTVDGKSLLEAPSYTRPQIFEGIEVPQILLSGNHGAVDQWREEQSIQRTNKIKQIEGENV